MAPAVPVPGNGFKGHISSSSSSSGRQKPGLVPVGRPLITCRSTSTSRKAKSKQPTMKEFLAKPTPLRMTTVEPRASTSTSTSDAYSAVFGASQRYESHGDRHHLGRAMINPVSRKVGPTVVLDGPQDPPRGENEMKGEEGRQKQNRILDGAPGQLDLVPAPDHPGFHVEPKKDSRRASTGKKTMRELEMLVEREDSESPAQSEEEDELQRSLVVTHRHSPGVVGSKRVVPVPDSDDEEEELEDEAIVDDRCGELAEKMGGGGDDSGFAEMEREPSQPPPRATSPEQSFDFQGYSAPANEYENTRGLETFAEDCFHSIPLSIVPGASAPTESFHSIPLTLEPISDYPNDSYLFHSIPQSIVPTRDRPPPPPRECLVEPVQEDEQEEETLEPDTEDDPEPDTEDDEGLESPGLSLAESRGLQPNRDGSQLSSLQLLQSPAASLEPVRPVSPSFDSNPHATPNPIDTHTYLTSELPVPSPFLDPDEHDLEDTQFPHSTLLGRTPSGLLMPPPSLPRRRSNLSPNPRSVVYVEATQTQATAARSRSRSQPDVYAPETLFPETLETDSQRPGSRIAGRRSPQPVVLVDATRTQDLLPPSSTRPPQPDMFAHETLFPESIEPQSIVDEESIGTEVISDSLLPASLLEGQEATPTPPPRIEIEIASTSFPSPPSVPPHPSHRKRAGSTSNWPEVELAWKGQHVSPPKPSAPRQSTLGEFFALPERDQVIEDSQMSAGLSLVEEDAFRLAQIATREILGRKPNGNGNENGLERVEEEEIDDPDEDVVMGEDDETVIPSSDQENDGPFSPLRTPNPARVAYRKLILQRQSTENSPPPSPSPTPTPSFARKKRKLAAKRQTVYGKRAAAKSRRKTLS